MSRSIREDWGPEHRKHVYWVEKAIAAVVLFFSLVAVPRTEGVAQYFFVGMGSVALWKLFPSLRPLLSEVVDRLPFLAKKGDPAPRLER